MEDGPIPVKANRVALVTGAGGGLGLAQVRRLAVEGWIVIAADSDETKFDDARVQASDIASFAALDVTSEAGWKKLFAGIAARFGPVSGLVNNAGTSTRVVPLHELAVEEWQRVLDVNATGAFLGTKHMIAQAPETGGAIVNIGSTAAVAGFGRTEVAYAASKAALIALTRSCAAQYGTRHIRCNAVLPGPVDTPMMREAYDNDEKLRDRLRTIPLRRFADTEEIAGLVSYLLGDAAASMTGETVTVDGGSQIF